MNTVINFFPKPVTLALAGAIGCVLASIPGEILEYIEWHGDIAMMASTMLWTALLAFGLVLTVAIVQNAMVGKIGLDGPQFVTLLVGSLVAGVVAGGAGQFLYGALMAMTESQAVAIAVRLVAWALVGGLMAFIIARFIPNLNILYATLGGLCGGTVGAIAFEILAYLFGVGYRQGGAFFLGLCIGFIIGLVENVCRRVWLTVVYSPRRFSQVNIGEHTVTAGSAPGDTIRIDGVPGSAIAFQMKNGVISCIENGITHTAQPGERYNVGKVGLFVCSPEHPYQSAQKLGGNNAGNASAPPFAPQRPTQPFAPQQSASPFAPQQQSASPFTPPQQQPAQQQSRTPGAAPSAPGSGGPGHKTIKLPPRN